MSWPVRIIDHPDRAVAALPWPVGESAYFTAFVRADARQVQDLEDTIWAFIYERRIDNAVGAQLEAWGETLDEPQGDLSIEEWRLFLKAKLQIPHSACRVDDITRALRAITGNHGPAHLYNYPPMRVGLAYFAAAPLSSAHRTRVRLWMERLTTGGVAIEHIIEKPLGGFGLDSDEDPNLEGLDAGLLGAMI